MVKQKMLCLTVRIKKNDEIGGKRLEKVIIEFLIKSKVSGAIVWLGVDGFGEWQIYTTLGRIDNQPTYDDRYCRRKI